MNKQLTKLTIITIMKTLKRPQKPVDRKGELILGMVRSFIDEQEEYIDCLESENKQLLEALETVKHELKNGNDTALIPIIEKAINV